MDVDPIASMRCWAITVELGGREFDIPALPAVDWWPALIGANPGAVLDLLPSDAALDEMLLDGTVSRDELSRVLEDVVGEATGRTFHAAFVLATVASAQWPVIGGKLAREGFRWDVQSIGAALDAIYSIVVGGLENKPRDEFLALLENEALTQPGKKRTPSKRVIDEFEAMAGPRPAPAPSRGKATGAPSGSPRPRTPTRPRLPRPDGRSGAPTSPPEPPGESGLQASSAGRAVGERQASGTEPHPPRGGRSRPRSRSAGPGSEPAPRT